VLSDVPVGVPADTHQAGLGSGRDISLVPPAETTRSAHTSVRVTSSDDFQCLGHTVRTRRPTETGHGTRMARGARHATVDAGPRRVDGLRRGAPHCRGTRAAGRILPYLLVTRVAPTPAPEGIRRALTPHRVAVPASARSTSPVSRLPDPRCRPTLLTTGRTALEVGTRKCVEDASRPASSPAYCVWPIRTTGSSNSARTPSGVASSCVPISSRSTTVSASALQRVGVGPPAPRA
jgi:hypothetical protein